MTTPPPHRGVFRWAWHRAVEYRARFWVGAVIFSILVSGIGAAIVLPDHPTLGQKLAAAAAALVGATILTGGGSYVSALVAAPFQQRNELRRLLAESDATVAALKADPVTQAHADRIRAVAGRLRKSFMEPSGLDYGEDAEAWRPAFHEHFPDVQAALDSAAKADAAFESFKRRLAIEARSEGMVDKPHWTPDRYLPWLATTIQARALQRILGTEFKFGWDFFAGAWCMGTAYPDDQRVFHFAHKADVPRLKEKFEEFFHVAEMWPEAAAIRQAWDGREAAEAEAVARLAEIANMDPITSRCKLCRGGVVDRSELSRSTNTNA